MSASHLCFPLLGFVSLLAGCRSAAPEQPVKCPADHNIRWCYPMEKEIEDTEQRWKEAPPDRSRGPSDHGFWVCPVCGYIYNIKDDSFSKYTYGDPHSFGVPLLPIIGTAPILSRMPYIEGKTFHPVYSQIVRGQYGAKGRSESLTYDSSMPLDQATRELLRFLDSFHVVWSKEITEKEISKFDQVFAGGKWREYLVRVMVSKGEEFTLQGSQYHVTKIEITASN